MRIRVRPGRAVGGSASVPGDKSIAHRWLLLAATAHGPSRLVGLPRSLDVRSTAACLAQLSGRGRRALEAWSDNGAAGAEGHGSTWNEDPERSTGSVLEVEGEGRAALMAPGAPLECGNSGTAMRLLAGIVAAAPFRTVLVGDASLSARPMERVAEPLRAMGATVRTTDGHAPIIVEGGTLRGIRHELATPSAQVKGAILLAGLAATGRTTVWEAAVTRDHTERAIAALGGPIERRGGEVSLGPFQHGGLEGSVPGDPSSAAFLLAAAAVTGAALTVEGVGLNPTRLGFVAVLARMGARTVRRVWHDELGEPVGALSIEAGASLRGTSITSEELPGVIDEVPVLAAMAASAGSETRFEGAAELRVKESDRLSGIEAGLRAMGADVAVEGEDLIVAGTGLDGGTARSLGDHRLAMAFAVAALAARRPGEIEDAEVADVSYPGFFRSLAGLGADVERTG